MLQLLQNSGAAAFGVLGGSSGRRIIRKDAESLGKGWQREIYQDVAWYGGKIL